MKQEVHLVPGELVRKDFPAAEVREGEADRLVECPFLHPAHAPVVDVPLPLVLVDDPLHGIVVAHPRHAHVVTHGGPHLRRGDLQESCKTARRLRVEPHEDGHAVDRLPPQCGVHALPGCHAGARHVSVPLTATMRPKYTRW